MNATLWAPKAPVTTKKILHRRKWKCYQHLEAQESQLILHLEILVDQKVKVKVIVLSTFRSTRKPALQNRKSQTCVAAGNRGIRDYLRTGCTRCGRRASQSWTRTTQLKMIEVWLFWKMQSVSSNATTSNSTIATITLWLHRVKKRSPLPATTRRSGILPS